MKMSPAHLERRSLVDPGSAPMLTRDQAAASAYQRPEIASSSLVPKVLA